MTAAGEAERLDRFMARAAATYYAARDPFGARGDFTTAPEISQAFGECLGLWAAVLWQQMGRPDPVLLVELGPGRGTLMADALRAIGGVMPAFRAALRLHLVEQSLALREAQRRALHDAAPTWHGDLSTLPPGPALILGNEFLDALPIRQFVRRGDGWRERFVLHGAFAEREPDPAPALPDEAPEGAVQEVSEACRDLATALGARLAAEGGAALFLDYGPARSALGDSLQALSAHRAADPLAAPGTVDITAHVDFQAVAEAARAAGAAVHGPVPQGIFLQSLGLVTRAATLARMAPARAGEQLSAAQRLIAPEGMGRLFKALALCHPVLSSLPGFESS
ncbi:class I SAM-dependent methyltransferase [Teichococcus oryzae]|uniref:Class I SAM-dependent methyltransferase n=1 Tax=Teichococcus oryzae TaxID=1608942 RepID=A0A5B2TKU1_9PROT|nr:SAM-dependent methyltransferase [Pseudoroseomonas oryzae]KAA2214794.1 class I SAM-dependent methyltransferase [Pseudoroseomonas oryzae]